MPLDFFSWKVVITVESQPVLSQAWDALGQNWQFFLYCLALLFGSLLYFVVVVFFFLVISSNLI